jgi:beta-barrel assembly-enhancing protease
MMRRALKTSMILSLAALSASHIFAPLSAQNSDQVSSLAEAQKPLRPSAFDYKPQDDDERSLWLAMDEFERETSNSKFLIRDEKLNRYIKSILCRTVGENKCHSTRIYLMQTPQFNAMMAPNGMMIVWTGLLLRARNEAQLAAVLGHEFAHFENQHSLQSLRGMRAKADAMRYLSFVPFVGIIGQIGMISSILEFGRDMERQSDMVALDYLVAARYDPMESSTIWKQIRAEMDAVAAAKGKPSHKDDNGGFWATHPATGERMEYLRAAAVKAPKYGYRVGEKEYRENLSDWWPRLIDDQIKLNDFGATEFLLSSLANGKWTSELLYARAELYRARGKKDDFQKSIGFYKQSIALNGLPENWRGLGVAYLRTGQPLLGKAALKNYLLKAPYASDKSIISMMAGK